MVAVGLTCSLAAGTMNEFGFPVVMHLHDPSPQLDQMTDYRDLGFSRFS